VNEDQKLEATARIEIVPFPSADDASMSVDAPDPDVRRHGDDGEDEDEAAAKRSKATGWASSGLAGALRRSSRRRGDS